MRPILLAALAATSLGGCTIDLNTKALCIEERPQAWIGQVFSGRAADRIKDSAKALRVRVLHPGDMATMDFNTRRVNVVVNAENRIERIYCG